MDNDVFSNGFPISKAKPGMKVIYTEDDGRYYGMEGVVIGISGSNRDCIELEVTKPVHGTRIGARHSFYARRLKLIVPPKRNLPEWF